MQCPVFKRQSYEPTNSMRDYASELLKDEKIRIGNKDVQTSIRRQVRVRV